jgi:hypothetical protein
MNKRSKHMADPNYSGLGKEPSPKKRVMKLPSMRWSVGNTAHQKITVLLLKW